MERIYLPSEQERLQRDILPQAGDIGLKWHTTMD